MINMIRHYTIALLLALVCNSSVLGNNNDATSAKERPADETKSDDKKADEKPNALQFKMNTIQGKEVPLKKKYAGKVILFVNVASQCGATPQYSQLQKLHDMYAAKGLAVVGVPCNQFGSQEPGSNQEILKFCKSNYRVTFDMLAKVNVNGTEACGLYQYLTSANTKPVGKGKVGWNFEKFIVNRSGHAVARFDSNVEPDAEELIKVIEAELAKK